MLIIVIIHYYLYYIAVIRPHRSTTYIDVAWCYRPSSMVCQSVTVVNPAKMAEPIDIPFGLWYVMAQGIVY